MRVLDYLRAIAIDFALCLVLAGCLSFVNAGAFFVDPALQYNYYLIAGVCAALLAVFFFAAFSKRTVVPGIALAFVALVVGALVAHRYADPSLVFYADDEGNPVVFFIVIFMSTLAVFAGTRKRAWSHLFYVALALDAAYIQFMYEQFYVTPVLIAVAACVVMVVFRNYRYNIGTASSTQISFLGALGVGAAFAAVVCGLALLIFFCVIAPLDPVAHEFKPFTRYLNFETIEMTGIGQNDLVQDPDITNDDLNEEEDDTEDESDEEDEETQSDEATGPLAAVVNMLLAAVENMREAIQQLYNLVINNPTAWPFLLAVLLALLYAPYGLKKRARKKRFEAMCALEPREQVRAFFHFFMKRFALLKIRKGELMTLREYVYHSRGQYVQFANNEGNVSFGDIIELYACVIYSEYEPTDEDLEMIRTFYSSFYKNFIEYGGRARYIFFFRFFRV